MEQTERLQMRVSPEFLQVIDDWRSHQRPIPTRSEAIRRLALQGADYANVRDTLFGFGEMLTLLLRDGRLTQAEEKSFLDVIDRITRMGGRVTDLRRRMGRTVAIGADDSQWPG